MSVFLLVLSLGILIQFSYLSWRISIGAYRSNQRWSYLFTLPVWFTFTFWLSIHGFFSFPVDFLPNDVAGANFLGFLAIAPVVLFFVQLRHSGSLNRYVASLAPRRLVFIQTFRALGVVFLVLYCTRQLPGILGIPIGIVELAMGLSAPFLAKYMDRVGRRGAAPWVMAWNTLGLASIAYFALIAILTFPWPALPQNLTPILKVAPSPILIGFYPIAFIAIFGMPLAVILHLLSMRSERSA